MIGILVDAAARTVRLLQRAATRALRAIAARLCAAWNAHRSLLSTNRAYGAALAISTTFKRTVTDTVCDNTREMALSEAGQVYKIKHSRRSQMRLADAREALEMVHMLADEFAAEIKQLCETTVTDAQWKAFIEAHVPVVDDKGAKLEGRSLTIAENKRSALRKLYSLDLRVAPWAGTAHGVLQCVNTFEHHENSVRGAERGERNMLRTVTGEFGNIDRSTWATLEKVLIAS